MKKMIMLSAIAALGFYSNSFAQEKIKQKTPNSRSVQTANTSIEVNDSVKIKNKNGKYKSKTSDGKIKNTPTKVKTKANDGSRMNAENMSGKMDQNASYNRSNQVMSDSGRMHNNRDSAWGHRRDMNDSNWRNRRNMNDSNWRNRRNMNDSNWRNRRNMNDSMWRNRRDTGVVR